MKGVLFGAARDVRDARQALEDGLARRNEIERLLVDSQLIDAYQSVPESELFEDELEDLWLEYQSAVHTWRRIRKSHPLTFNDRSKPWDGTNLIGRKHVN